MLVSRSLSRSLTNAAGEFDLTGTDCGIGQRPLQHVALRVRTAERVEARPDRQQLRNDIGVTTLRERDRGPRCRQTDLGSHHDVRRRVRRTRGNETREVLDDRAGIIDTTGAAQREDRVQVVEDVPRLVHGLGCPRVRERSESSFGVDSVEHEAPQERTGVEELERHTSGCVVVDLRRRRSRVRRRDGRPRGGTARDATSCGR